MTFSNLFLLLSLSLCYLKIWDKVMYLKEMWWRLKDNAYKAQSTVPGTE